MIGDLDVSSAQVREFAVMQMRMAQRIERLALFIGKLLEKGSC
jgi:hypothetical protein